MPPATARVRSPTRCSTRRSISCDARRVKVKQQNRARRNAAFDEPGDPVNQRASLARAGAGDDQDRSVAMSNGGELRGIEQLGVLDAEAALVNLFARGAQYDHFVGHGVTILPRRGAMSFR